MIRPSVQPSTVKIFDGTKSHVLACISLCCCPPLDSLDLLFCSVPSLLRASPVFYGDVLYLGTVQLIRYCPKPKNSEAKSHLAHLTVKSSRPQLGHGVPRLTFVWFCSPIFMCSDTPDARCASWLEFAVACQYNESAEGWLKVQGNQDACPSPGKGSPLPVMQLLTPAARRLAKMMRSLHQGSLAPTAGR